MHSHHPQRILIVDDNIKNIQVLGSVLAKQGYSIFTATSGAQALEKLREITVDLILLDILMPEMDGYETAKLIKKNPQTLDIPIIFLTAKTDPEDIVQGFEIGAVDFITKPFNATELLARLNTHLELKAAREMLKKQNRERRELLHLMANDITNALSVTISLLENVDNDDGLALLHKLKDETLTRLNNAAKLIKMTRNMQSLVDKEYHFDTQEMAPMNLREIVEDTVQLVRRQIEFKHQTIEDNIPNDLKVNAQMVAFSNVLTNTLSNASKFSYPGNTIHLSAVKEGDYVKLTVADQGIGIPGDLLNPLFDAEATTLRPGTEGETGSGYGMFLARSFAEAMDGRIEVTSRDIKHHPDNHGTEVTIYLQAAK